jgi:hypothetical protein
MAVEKPNHKAANAKNYECVQSNFKAARYPIRVHPRNPWLKTPV